MSETTVEFHRLAAREVRKGRDWYDQQRAGLGRAFTLEVDRAVEFIAANPERWATFRQKFRWKGLRRFPYVLYYHVINPTHVLVLAVSHGRRRPGYWLRRATHP
jgi:plasmid stabilization system protein ParE